MIETSLGRRWSLAGSTLATAFFCVVFIYVEASWAVRGTTMAISLCATVCCYCSFVVHRCDSDGLRFCFRRCGRCCMGMFVGAILVFRLLMVMDGV